MMPKSDMHIVFINSKICLMSLMRYMMNYTMRPTLIISGGQTGADQGGLYAAEWLGIPTGGWIPKGWRTDNGPDPELKRFNLQEHADWQFKPRTYANAAWGDGTVWFGQTNSPGYFCTRNGVKAAGKPPMLENPTAEELRAWVTDNNIVTLNVAGNRERTNPGIFERTRQTIVEAFRDES
jgi:putative molybdenum carrier protein